MPLHLIATGTFGFVEQGIRTFDGHAQILAREHTDGAEAGGDTCAIRRELRRPDLAPDVVNPQLGIGQLCTMEQSQKLFAPEPRREIVATQVFA